MVVDPTAKYKGILADGLRRTLENDAMATNNGLYATDEDIAVRSPADYALLVPKEQKLAWGDDGQFLNGNPWILNSRSVDFRTSGLLKGHILFLSQPSISLTSSGEQLCVETVDGSSVTLRRKGQPVGVGLAPTHTIGAGAIVFGAWTLSPQIEAACSELKRRFGIEESHESVIWNEPVAIQELKDATVLTVLYRRYMDLCRGQNGKDDSFLLKAQSYKSELDEALSRAVFRCAGTIRAAAPTTLSSRFGMRLGR